MIHFNYLSNEIRKYIYNKNWKGLHSIQEKTIECFFNTNNHIIISAPTASGKTEAVLFPVLSSIEKYVDGIQVLYVAPLKALINDQQTRMNSICKELEIPVTKWHGDVSLNIKNQLIRQPFGILMITPESLEALYLKEIDLNQFFYNLKFVIVDEIHAFFNSDRGLHLQSLLFRIKKSKTKLRFLGISATIEDTTQALSFFGEKNNTELIEDDTPKKYYVDFYPFNYEKVGLKDDFLNGLVMQLNHENTLLFVNNKFLAKQLYNSLQSQLNLKISVFLHHADIDKNDRNYIEQTAKETTQKFCIISTSTLEMGIDIGNIDRVIQIGSPLSVSSFKQRLGRSGRRNGEAKISLYYKDLWEFLEIVVISELAKQSIRINETEIINQKPYHVLVHEIIGLVGANQLSTLEELIQNVITNPVFSKIEATEIIEVINFLLLNNYIEKHSEILYLGYKGEKLISNKDFYSFVVPSCNDYQYLHNELFLGKFNKVNIGKIVNISNKNYLTTNIYHKSKTIEVQVSEQNNGIHLTSSMDKITSSSIREKMRELIVSGRFKKNLTPDEIVMYDNEFKPLEQGFLLKEGDKYKLFTFAGTTINKTLSLYFNVLKIQHVYTEKKSLFIFKNEIKLIEILKGFEKFVSNTNLLEESIRKQTHLLKKYKFAEHLPIAYQTRLLLENEFDFEKTLQFVKNRLQLINDLNSLLL